MLTALILVPAVSALVVMLLPSQRKELALPVGFGLSFIPLAIAGYLFFRFETGVAGYQFTQQAVWYEPWGISWNIGVDGISLGMVVLSTILIPISLAASTSITDRTKEFVVFALLLEAGLIGSFLALDLFLFFVFFEAVLVPMYFIIGIWGSERRIYAALKFFVYTAFGSAFLLASIVALSVLHNRQFGVPSFDLVDSDEPRPVADRGPLAVRRVRHRLRHQGAGVPAAHLVARCPRRRPPPPGRCCLPVSC